MINIKIISYFTSFLCTNAFKYSMYFTLTAHLNLYTPDPSEISELYSDFVKFTTDETDSHSSC